MQEYSLEELRRKLENRAKNFSVYYDRMKEDWEGYSKGLTGNAAASSAIYTFLHKHNQSIGI